MAITKFLDSTSMPARTQDQQTFDNNMAGFMQDLPVAIAQINATEAGMNSVAAGGAYAIPYKFVANVAVAGDLSVDNPAAQSSTATLRISTSSTSGSVAPTLATFGASTSAVKGHIKVVKVGDTSKWLLFAVTSSSLNSGYYALGVTLADSSAANPFTIGDAVNLSFQRTGDKGDPGQSQAVKFSDRKPSGTAGGTATAATFNQVRALNTTDYNTIPSGVSLSANRFTLPAGTYDIWGRAPAYNCTKHKAALYNVTAGAFALIGSNEYVVNGSAIQSSSEFSGRLTLASPQTFEVRHYISVSASSGGDLGIDTSSGQSEVYTEVIAIKAI